MGEVSPATLPVPTRLGLSRLEAKPWVAQELKTSVNRLGHNNSITTTATSTAATSRQVWLLASELERRQGNIHWWAR